MKHLITILILTLICLPLTATKKDAKWVKRHYKSSYVSIQEWGLRHAPDQPDDQQKEIYKQCKAFKFLAEKWENNQEKDRAIITTALLRWGWLNGDGFPDNEQQVDYYLVYMEYRQKKQQKY
jgi:hypothetical protein